ncbi:DUF6622 family protein [Acidisoma sp. 7E03]
MTAIIEALKHTPWWVYLVLYVLVRRGIAARQANVVPLWRLALLPLIFAGLDIEGILANPAITPGLLPVWLITLAAGAVLGHLLTRQARVRADHAQWLIGLEGDSTVLPLILVIFALKYAVGYLTGAEPALRANLTFLLFTLAVGGFCTGIFVGRFTTYFVKFRQSPSESLAVPAPRPAR